MEGSFDLSGSVEAVDFTIGRNYGFKVKVRSCRVKCAGTGTINTEHLAKNNPGVCKRDGLENLSFEKTVILTLFYPPGKESLRQRSNLFCF